MSLGPGHRATHRGQRLNRKPTREGDKERTAGGGGRLNRYVNAATRDVLAWSHLCGIVTKVLWKHAMCTVDKFAGFFPNVLRIPGFHK